MASGGYPGGGATKAAGVGAESRRESKAESFASPSKKAVASEIVPRRLGLRFDRSEIILEYEVPRHKHRALHFMKVEAEGPGGAAEDDVEAVARKLRDAHAPWLGGVSPKQLEDLVAQLLKGGGPKQERPAGSAARPVEAESEAAPAPAPAPVPAPAPAPAPARAARAPQKLGDEEAQDLRALLFGRRRIEFQPTSGLPNEWLQGWCFEPQAKATCPYGLRQAEGGPCGIVAPVQAFLLRRLLMAPLTPPEATAEQCRAGLLDALTDVLLQLQPEGSAVRVLALPAAGNTAAARRRLLCAPQGCMVHEFADRAALRQAWEAELAAGYLSSGDDGDDSAGVLLFLYSAMATHGAQRIRAEADVAEEAMMIGAHGYCTQEAVNLLLTGAASSNVFDGEKHLGGSPMSKPSSPSSPSSPSDGGLHLRGILAQSDVGFLSLFEAFGSIAVGSFFKSPRWPVWVCHAESHYSVLFGVEPPSEVVRSPKKGGTDSDSEEETGEPCDIWYYDPQGRQDEEKRISVRPGGLDQPFAEDDLEENGMIAKVIRTRWGQMADLDWNGAEPIF